MIRFDIHTHTIASGHATHSTIADMAKQAAGAGLTMLGITDHGPATMGSCKPSYFRSLTMAPKKRCGIDMLYGVELNILDNTGSVDLPDDILSGLDYAIASMHMANKKPGTIDENTRAYIAAMKNPYVKLIGHCDDTKYPVDYDAMVRAAKEHDVLLEINNASLSPDGYRGDTTWNNQSILRYCQKYRHPIVLSSDSHGTAHVGDMQYAEAFVKQQNFPEALILNSQPELFRRFIAR